MIMNKPESLSTGTDQRWTDSDKRAAVTNEEMVLSLLQSTPGWVGSKQLRDTYYRFSACIRTLRLNGHVIDQRRSADGEHQWRYIKKVEVVKVDDDWKQRYYESPHWKTLSYRRRQFDGHKCCHCKKTAGLQVHHWVYDLFEEDIEDLTTLCGDCHERIHSHIPIAFPSVVTPEIHERLCSGYVANTTPVTQVGNQGSLF
jgi:5-methylcytosine-specific restriction endonuclease McrA